MTPSEDRVSTWPRDADLPPAGLGHKRNHLSHGAGAWAWYRLSSCAPTLLFVSFFVVTRVARPDNVLQETVSHFLVLEAPFATNNALVYG